MTKKVSYTEAMTELETIVKEIEDGSLNIDELTSKVKRASELVKICEAKLHETDEEIEKILKGIG